MGRPASDDAALETENLVRPGAVEAEEQAELLDCPKRRAPGGPAAGAGRSAARRRQSKANEQRASVGQVQQQIQVLAADQRNIEEQSRALGLRHGKAFELPTKMRSTRLMRRGWSTWVRQNSASAQENA